MQHVLLCIRAALLGTLALTNLALGDVEPVQDSVSAADGTELPLTVYRAAGDRVLIWYPSEAGVQPGEEQAAVRLAQAGTEVWLVDVFSAHFLPVAESSLAQVPGSDLTALIEHARSQGKQRIFLAGGGRAAVALLRGAHEWQQRHADESPIRGMILISPKFFVETPDPGTPARLYPVVGASNLPLFIVQPAQSPWRWKLDQTVPALESSGSDVFVWILRGVRDRFYFRPDAFDREQALGQQLPRILNQAQRLLETLPDTRRSPGALLGAEPEVRVGKKERSLKPYAGDARAPALNLPDLEGRTRSLEEERGRVLLINFWASWCPPCVHEMPSMQRLARRFADQPFRILAVNMAEDRAAVETFLTTKVNVEFPILLDEDGAALKRWQVFAFPTSYVIDKRGKIRFALFGAVDWDDPEFVATFQRLLQE